MSDIYPRLACSFVITLLFLYLYYNEKEKFLGIWAIAWFFWFNNYVYRIVLNENTFQYYWLFFEFNTLFISICLIWGGLEVNNKKITLPIYAIFFADIIWLIISHFFEISLFWLPYGFSADLLFTFSAIFTGILFIENKTLKVNDKIYVGIVLILLGLTNITYPWTGKEDFILSYPTYALIEDIFVLMLQFLLAVTVVITYFNNTKLKLRTALEKAEAANIAKSQFIANISHEFRTPLNAVIGFAGILKQSGLEPKNENLTIDIENSGLSLLEMLNDIIDISKIEIGDVSLNKSLLSLKKLLDQIKSMYFESCANKGVALNFISINKINKLVIVDKTKLKQALINVLNNSVKFTNSGSIDVTAEIKSENGKANLYFTIIDTGIGIKDKNLPYIFDKFSQFEDHEIYGGLGIGLTISKTLIDAMGGTIEIISPDNKGTYVIININNIEVSDVDDLYKPIDFESRIKVNSLLIESENNNFTQEELNQFYTNYKESLMTDFKKLDMYSDIDSFENFSADLKKLNSVLSYPPILNWTIELDNKIELFNIEQILLLIEKFPVIIEKLEETINK